MSKPEKAKHIADHLLIFSVYMRIGVDTLQKELIEFYKRLPKEEQNRREDRIRIKAWFAKTQMPQGENIVRLNSFFREMIAKNEKMRGFNWSDDWIITPLKLFKNRSGIPTRLMRAVDRFLEPNAIARSFKAQKRQWMSEKIIEHYGLKIFLFIAYTHQGTAN